MTPNRTRLPPPPTANIQHGGSNVHTPISKPCTPHAGATDKLAMSAASSPAGVTDLSASAEFAPNAFGPDFVPQPTPSIRVPGGQYASSANVYASESHWYDRILDLLMGDDETAAKNRLVLICSSCRLVNGQAPPGTRSLAEVGSWKCMGCGALNGEVSEAKKIVKEMLQRKNASEVADSEADSEDMEDELLEADAIGIKEEDNPFATGRDTAGADKGSRKRGRKAN